MCKYGWSFVKQDNNRKLYQTRSKAEKRNNLLKVVLFISNPVHNAWINEVKVNGFMPFIEKMLLKINKANVNEFQK